MLFPLLQSLDPRLPLGSATISPDGSQRTNTILQQYISVYVICDLIDILQHLLPWSVQTENVGSQQPHNATAHPSVLHVLRHMRLL
jgi:hypothetical protein